MTVETEERRKRRALYVFAMAAHLRAFFGHRFAPSVEPSREQDRQLPALSLFGRIFMRLEE